MESLFGVNRRLSVVSEIQQYYIEIDAIDF